MTDEMVREDVVLDLSIEDDRFHFSTSIADALTQAQSDRTALNETIDSVKKLKPNCDKLDYALAASLGALCGVIDIFLVGKPGESPLGKITDGWFSARTIDFANLCYSGNGNFDSLDSALRFLEEKFKVPYDQTGLGDAGRDIFGLNAKNHHFKSLAHNPTLLGLFFSILDQFMDTSHFVTDGQLISLQEAMDGWELRGGNIVSKLFCGFVNWLGHLISDMSGSSSGVKSGSRGMGIPSPLWAWTNDVIAIKSKLGFQITETDKSLNNIALRIFEKGYDFRFQATQAIPVILNELLVRFIYSIRRLFKYYTETPREKRTLELAWKACEPFSNATVKRMLTVAHGTFCLLDVGDATIRSFAAGGGNFNPVEFILRVNIVGVGRFAISLYGEAKMAITRHHVKVEADFASRELIIVNDYIDGLEYLSKLYDDAYLLTFVSDFEKSDAYIKAFEKSVALAKLRRVSESKILKSKTDINKYFGGC